MRWAAAVCTIAAVAIARPAVADDLRDEPGASGSRDPTDAAGEPSPGRRALAISLAVVPGALVRGTGSYLVGRSRAARRLAWMAGLGAVAALAGGLPTRLTGGSPYVIVPGVPIAIAGVGLFVSSWFTDLWVAAGGDKLAPAPRAPAPYAIELGSLWLRDAYRRRLYAQGAARVAVGRVELAAAGRAHAGGDAHEESLGATIRLRGPSATGEVVEDTTRLALRLGVRAGADADDMTAVYTAECEVMLRIDHRRIARVLLGTFTELTTGLGVERTRYDAGGRDLRALLLGRFAWGMSAGDRGELRVFYDHRRDSLAGGIAAGRAAGFVGSVGATAELRVVGPWAVRAGLELGSGWVTSAALRYQGGPR